MPAPVEDDDDETTNDPLDRLLDAVPKIKRKAIAVTWDFGVFGIVCEVPTYITYRDALEIYHGDRMLNISIIHVWCM